MPLSRSLAALCSGASAQLGPCPLRPALGLPGLLGERGAGGPGRGMVSGPVGGGRGFRAQAHPWGLSLRSGGSSTQARSLRNGSGNTRGRDRGRPLISFPLMGAPPAARLLAQLPRHPEPPRATLALPRSPGERGLSVPLGLGCGSASGAPRRGPSAGPPGTEGRSQGAPVLAHDTRERLCAREPPFRPWSHRDLRTSGHSMLGPLRHVPFPEPS